MSSLHDYPFLQAALDDMLLVSELTGRGIGTPRHIVSLLHDAVEFMLYESLLALDQDIYKNGQNTIGLDTAMAHCKTHGIDLPLLGTIRTIQKHRGDAKHHAQTPHEAVFAKIMGEFRIIASRLVYEQFGQVLGSEIQALGLLPYHIALYESYRKHRTHNWNLALRFALSALLHKHRAVLGDNDDYSAAKLREPTAILDLLSQEVARASYPPAPLAALESLKKLPDDVASLLKERKIREATEVAGHNYARVDEVLPGVFDIQHARRFTERLVQPESLLIGRGMSWSKWQRGDTQKKHDAEARLRDLLKQRPALVKAFGKPHYEEDDNKYWRWWEFAVFEGTKWHTFLLDDLFSLALESGSLNDEEASRREQVAEIILAEFERATGDYQT